MFPPKKRNTYIVGQGWHLLVTKFAETRLERMAGLPDLRAWRMTVSHRLHLLDHFQGPHESRSKLKPPSHVSLPRNLFSCSNLWRPSDWRFPIRLP